MSGAELDLLEALRWHLELGVLACARVLPMAWLCPLLGGRAAPAPVRFGLGLALALYLDAAGAAIHPSGSALGGLVPACLREGCLGVALGLLASAPLEAARLGGRLVDLARGTSAEASLPGAGNREAATSEVLAQALLALGLSSGALLWTVRALVRSTLVVPLGAPVGGGEAALAVARSVTGILASGLSLAAPVAGLSLMVDAVVGLAARGGNAPGLFEVAAPARILGGAAVLWLALGVVADRVLTELAASPSVLSSFLERVR